MCMRDVVTTLDLSVLQMADILEKLLGEEIPLNTFIERLLRKNQTVDSTKNDTKDLQDNILEFIPFFLNYLREKTSHHFVWRQHVPTPKKSRPGAKTQDINQNINTSSCENVHKHSSRGLNFTSQKTPSPSAASSSSYNRRDRHYGRTQSPVSSPATRRKSPRVTPSHNPMQTTSPLVGQQSPNLDNLDDFPSIGSISTPKSKKAPLRRITPTPVKADKERTPSPFSEAFSSPIVEDPGFSPSSLQEERNMLKAIKSKRRAKGDSWNSRTSPSPQPNLKSPPYSVFGDYITSSPIPVKSPEQTVNRTTTDYGANAKSTKQSMEKNINMGVKPHNEHHNFNNYGDNSTDRTCFNNDVRHSEKKDGEHSNGSAVVTSLPEIGVAGTTPKTNHKNIETVERVKVTFQNKIHVLGRLHATLIQESLVPNVTSEVYFVAQLLTTRASNEQSQTAADPECTEPNVLHSIHNTVYFAVVILENIKRIISLLDKGTLGLLVQNTRIAEFAPSFKEWLDKTHQAHFPTKALDIPITSPIGGVPFSADRDNRNNFASDKAFQNFKKQRDAFYELVREWEDCHNKLGWTMEESMGNRIRNLVHQRPELANHAPFARLFQSQILQMCKGEDPNSRENGMLAHLRKSNPDKFQRLQDRFVTPLSLGGPCPPPTFTEIQDFFKGFIACAESHSFSRHLMDQLVMKITELNDTVFPLDEVKDKDSAGKTIQTKELQHTYNVCMGSLRILAKFLGYLAFEPYHGVSQSKQAQMEPVIRIRNKVPQPFDVLHYIQTAALKGHLVLTVPWVVEYLCWMDPVAPHLDYYLRVLYLLVQIYRSPWIPVPNECSTHSQLLIVTCLGWLFEIPVIPESLFYTTFEQLDTCTRQDVGHTALACLDSCDIVDQQMLYSWCPYLGEVKSVLSEASSGMSSRTGPMKKITPVCTDKPTQMSSNKRQLLRQLEENFYRIQPEYLKRTSDFILERLCSNVLSRIKSSIVPAALKTGAQQMENYLASIGFPNDDNSDQAKEKSRPQVLQLIHSVTSDAVKKALEITENCNELSLKAFQILCPEDTNPKVISTAAKLAARHVKQKSHDWIHLSLASTVEKDLFAHFDKFTNALLHAKVKEARLRGAARPKTDSSNNTLQDKMVDHHNTNHVSKHVTNHVTNHVKAIKVLLVEQTGQLNTVSNKADYQNVVATLTAVLDDLKADKLTMTGSGVYADLSRVSVESAFILACRYSSELLSDKNAMTTTLLQLWKLFEDHDASPPLRHLLSPPRLRLLDTLQHPETAWTAISSLLSSVTHCGLVPCYTVEQWFISLLDTTDDQIIRRQIGQACCELLRSYTKQATRHGVVQSGVEFSLLMETLYQQSSQDSKMTDQIHQCIKDSGAPIVLPGQQPDKYNIP